MKKISQLVESLLMIWLMRWHQHQIPKVSLREVVRSNGK
jgi:hypothetical protein